MIRFLLLLVVLASVRVYAQEQASRTWEFVAPIASERSIDSADLKKTSTWLEHKEERTYFSKFFADENGQTRHIFSSVPLHYAGPNGELLPYDLSFRQSANYSIFENQEYILSETLAEKLEVLDDLNNGIELEFDNIKSKLHLTKID